MAAPRINMLLFAIVVALFATPILAQAQIFLGDCAQSCLDGTISTSGCRFSDPSCFCNGIAVANFGCCVAKSCSEVDQGDAIATFESICAGENTPSVALVAGSTSWSATVTVTAPPRTITRTVLIVSKITTTLSTMSESILTSPANSRMNPTPQVSSNTIKSPGVTGKPTINPEDDQELGDAAMTLIAISVVTGAVSLAVLTCYLMLRKKPSLPDTESEGYQRAAEAVEDGSVISASTDQDTEAEAHEIEDPGNSLVLYEPGIVSGPVVLFDTPTQPIDIPDPEAPKPRRWLPDDDLAGNFLPYNAGLL